MLFSLSLTHTHTTHTHANRLKQFAASKGYNLLPLDRLQKYVKNVDLRRAMSEHRPFKMSFGATMALAAFAHF